MSHARNAAGSAPQAVGGALKHDTRTTMNTLFLKMYVKVQDLMSREEGQDLVEYALLITLIALAAVAGINKVSSAINAVFSKVSTTLS
jgi:pilus assembly protein Flp/PilA